MAERESGLVYQLITQIFSNFKTLIIENAI